MLVVGACEILSLILVLALVEKGYITRTNALFLIISWTLFMLIVRNYTKKMTEKIEADKPKEKRYLYHFTLAALGFAGIAIGAYLVIQSVITLSEIFNISEYVVSFFAVAIGTSLPEFFVNVAAVRKNQFQLTIGNTLGSCIFDACFSIGIGPLLFPITVSANLAMITGTYALIGSALVILMMGLRGKVDKKLEFFSWQYTSHPTYCYKHKICTK